MNKIFKKEILIGLIVIIAMAVLIIGIDFLKGVNVFKAANYYYATYDNVAGLAKSAPVTINGFKVGLVRDIRYEYNNPGHMLVELSLDRELKVPAGTKAVLATDLLGTASIALELAPQGRFHEVGDTLTAVVPKGLMDNVTTELLPQVGNIFPKVDTLLTSVNALVGDPALISSVQRLNDITANLERATRQLNSLLATLPPISANINTMTKDMTVSTANIAEITTDINNVPVDSIADNIKQLTDNLRLLSSQLNDPNSSLGLLTRDPQLYNNLNSAVSNLDSLFVDIKRNPKRYISIKLL